jgi:SAM-dependent methyltransferase
MTPAKRQRPVDLSGRGDSEVSQVLGMPRAVRQSLYRYGWDMRCRNWIAARMLHEMLSNLPEQNGPQVLDAGCGAGGVAGFLGDLEVAGVDLETPGACPRNLTFQQASVLDLPFSDRAFPVVACIDVIEHLPLNARKRALQELVRVAGRAVLITCPNGQVAERADAEFRRSLDVRGHTVPEWLLEHQAQPYPTSSAVANNLREAAHTGGRSLGISFSYGEPIDIARIVRGAAARWRGLYVAANLLFGMLLPLVPEPAAANAYRMLALGEFDEPRTGS